MKSVEKICREIRDAKIDGFGGNCAKAAFIIHETILGGKGKICGAVNKKLLECGHVVGHFAVEYNGLYFDADGVPKEWEDIESWGMVAPDDQEYIDLLDLSEEDIENEEWSYEVKKIFPTREWFAEKGWNV